MNDAEAIARELEKWFKRYGRKFLWRKVSDPYKVMVVEFLLQRTRAETVEKVYSELFRKFPDMQSLGKADIKEVEDIFRKLGLLYRAERLHAIAKSLLNSYGGRVPCSMESLLRLKGIGVYMASAILNFGYNVPTPVVDKNVMRVTNRVWGVVREKDARSIIERLYKFCDHRTIAYALIDLGALVCRDEPRCDVCPIDSMCPKIPLSKEKWKMMRKVVETDGKIVLREQPVFKLARKKRLQTLKR